METTPEPAEPSGGTGPATGLTTDPTAVDLTDVDVTDVDLTDVSLTEEDRACVERLLRDAATRGVTVQLIRRGPANSLAEAAAALGVEPRRIVKTLVARAKVTQTAREHSYVLALIPGDRQVDWAKLRRLAGMKKMSLTAPEETVEATGHRPGTITPVGAESSEGTRWPIYADENITGGIAMGAGATELSLVVDSAALFAAYDVVTGDITRATPQE
ncbi:aminoacyl-tRNA deacylase [Nesterenkonia suensis]